MWRECTPLNNHSISCSGGADGSARAFWFGGNIGGVVRSSPASAVVPFAGGAYARSRITAGGLSATDDYFEFSAGVGLVFNRLTVRPNMSFPIGLEGGRLSAGIEFAFNFGPKT